MERAVVGIGADRPIPAIQREASEEGSPELSSVCAVSEPLLPGAALLFHDQEMWCFVMFTMQTCVNAMRSF